METSIVVPENRAIAENFVITPTGLEIRGDIDYSTWEYFGQEVLMPGESAFQWAIGDWWNYGEHRYGEDASQAEDATKLKRSSLQKYASIARSYEFGIRIPGLSFNHHRVAVNLVSEKRQELLELAKSEHLSVRELKELVTAFKRAELHEQSLEEALSSHRFPIWYADPPWQYSNSGFEGAAEQQYPTMSVEDICEMPVGNFTTENAVIFLWATNPLLPEALRVMDAWGFVYKTNFVWVKQGRSMYGELGFYNYGQHELLLLGVKNEFPPQKPLFSSLIEEPKHIHSKKPETVYDLIESMYPMGPYIELFARNRHPGWRAFGNEAPE